MRSKGLPVRVLGHENGNRIINEVMNHNEVNESNGTIYWIFEVSKYNYKTKQKTNRNTERKQKDLEVLL